MAGDLKLLGGYDNAEINQQACSPRKHFKKCFRISKEILQFCLKYGHDLSMVITKYCKVRYDIEFKNKIVFCDVQYICDILTHTHTYEN